MRCPVTAWVAILGTTAMLAPLGAGQQQPPAQPATAPPASTEALTVVEEQATPVFTRMCTKCHPPDRILSQRRTKTQWEEVLEKMTKLGASGTDEEWDTVQGYLLRHYGRINVNKAQADDLVQILDLPPADAAAIVAYRKAQGDFPDFDALLKVPAVNTEKLQHARTAITF